MFEVNIQEDASRELTEAAVFYEVREDGLGELFLQEVQKSLISIAHFPLIGSQHLEHFRRYLIPRFPFSVVYRSDGEKILVLAFAHTSRRPGYWSERK